MSKARQSKRQRYRKPRADYQAGGRVNARSGGRRFMEKDAIMTNRGGKKIPKRKNPTTPKPTQTLIEGPLKKETSPPNYEAEGSPAQIRQFEQNQAPDTTTNQPITYRAEPTIAKLPENVTGNPASLTTTRRGGRKIPRRDPEPTTEEQETTVTSFVPADNNEADNEIPDDARGSENVSNNQGSSSGNEDKPITKPTDNPVTGILDKEAREERIKKYETEIDKGLRGELPDSAKLSDPSEEDGTKLIYESAKEISGKDPIKVPEPTETPESKVVDPMDDEVVKTVDDVEKAKDVTIDPITGKRKEATQIDLDELSMVDEDADVKVAEGELSDESTVDIDDVKVKGVDSIEAARVADEFRSDDPEANAALVKEVTGKLSPGAKAEVVKVAGLSERKITRYKKQLRNAGLSEDEIKEIGNDPSALEDRVLDFSEEERGVIEGLPEEALVSTQIEGLLEGMEEGNPPSWARPAIAAVNQMLAQRGMSASTVGRDALFNAVIQSAMPIAQSNAQAIQASVSQSKDIEAKAAMQDAAMAQERAVQYAGNVFNMDMANFNAKQQAAVANAKYFQTVALEETNNRQQAAIQDAVITSQLNIAEADMQTKARINNANAFLNLDMTNLKNQQQANIAEAQIENQRMLSNQAAVNTAISLNTQEQNKVDMFMTNMQKEIEIANAAQVNNMAQFNTNQENAATAREADRELDRRKANAAMAQDIDKFNADMKQRRDTWNAANAAAVQAADVAYHRKTNEVNTATQNAVNLQNAMNGFNMTVKSMAFLNQEMRDQADFEFKAYEAEEQRAASVIVGALGADSKAYEQGGWSGALRSQINELIKILT
tara:strand:+ start:28 stop:2529 length:2502 start_codon:yes stop_codon:yes gene_type:complete